MRVQRGQISTCVAESDDEHRGQPCAKSRRGTQVICSSGDRRLQVARAHAEYERFGNASRWRALGWRIDALDWMNYARLRLARPRPQVDTPVMDLTGQRMRQVLEAVTDGERAARRGLALTSANILTLEISGETLLNYQNGEAPTTSPIINRGGTMMTRRAVRLMRSRPSALRSPATRPPRHQVVWSAETGAQ